MKLSKLRLHDRLRSQSSVSGVVTVIIKLSGNCLHKYIDFKVVHINYRFHSPRCKISGKERMKIITIY